jgi:hypothetical protein
LSGNALAKLFAGLKDKVSLAEKVIETHPFKLGRKAKERALTLFPKNLLPPLLPPLKFSFSAILDIRG